MKKNVGTEIKVGIFVSIGLGLILLAILILGGQSLLSRKSKYSAHFSDVDGLISGTKVTLGGVPIGVVDAINFDFEQHNIEVHFSVSQEATQWIRSNSTVEITTQGVLGDKYLSIQAGSQSNPILPPGSDIPHRPGKDLSQFLTKGDQLMVSLNSIAVSLDHILKNFESDNRSDTFFKGMAATARNMGQATGKLNRELDDLQLKSAIIHLNQIFEKIDNGTGTVGALINDPGIYDQLKALLGGANRNRIIRNLVRQTIKNSEEGSSEAQSQPSPKK